jgi:hypothetical protein
MVTPVLNAAAGKAMDSTSIRHRSNDVIFFIVYLLRENFRAAFPKPLNLFILSQNYR